MLLTVFNVWMNYWNNDETVTFSVLQYDICLLFNGVNILFMLSINVVCSIGFFNGLLWCLHFLSEGYNPIIMSEWFNFLSANVQILLAPVIVSDLFQCRAINLFVKHILFNFTMFFEWWLYASKRNYNIEA